MLRAVKVSFEGSGPAMDAWCSVDGGMVAKPGTHLPLVSASHVSVVVVFAVHTLDFETIIFVAILLLLL